MKVTLWNDMSLAPFWHNYIGFQKGAPLNNLWGYWLNGKIIFLISLSSKIGDTVRKVFLFLLPGTHIPHWLSKTPCMNLYSSYLLSKFIWGSLLRWLLQPLPVRPWKLVYVINADMIDAVSSILVFIRLSTITPIFLWKMINKHWLLIYI